MTSRPSSSGQRITGRLRHKMVAIWLGSILIALLLVGLVLTALMDDFRRREAQRDIGAAMAQFRHSLVEQAAAVLRHADQVAARRDVTATINLVHRYQDVGAYQPMVFDGEKRTLAQVLADRVHSGDLHFAAIYDGRGKVIAFARAVQGRASPAHHTVVDGAEVLLSEADGNWRSIEAPPLLRRGRWVDSISEGDVLFRSVDGRVVMETFVPVERSFPDAPLTTVGWVHMARQVEAQYLSQLGAHLAVDMAVRTQDRQVGTLPNVLLPPIDLLPDIAATSECGCSWVETEGLTIGAARLELDEGGPAVVMVGASNQEASAIGRYYQVSAVVVLVVVAGVVGPIGFLMLNRVMVIPLSRLLAGLEALRTGRRVRLGDQFRDDEFGVLAKGFDAMADSIAERERELQTSIDQLARSNADLQRFAVVAAHDLQEPLRMVTSYTQLLQRRYQGKLDPDADEFIAYAVEGADRMKTLIQNLLDYSRVDGDQNLFADVALSEVVASVQRLMADAVAETGAHIRIQALPEVRGNAIQLGQVFQNLLSNALKFRNGPPEIEIGARRDGNEWVISVEDNGIGIDPAYLPQLFTLFRRLHTQREYPGSGLGLAIARRIVERHGGRIWAEPRPGGGTIFRFTLPV